MSFKILLRTFLLVAFLCALAVNAFAQCGGVFFKTTNREIYASFPFVQFGTESSPVLSRHKDINGDGKVDLVGGGLLNNQIYVAPGEGGGNFGTPVYFWLPNPSEFYVEDFTGDGLKDFLVQTYDTFPRKFQIYRNDGNLSFTPLALTETTGAFETVRNVVDINNDNRADILFTSTYRLANADGTFGAPVTVQTFGVDFSFPIDFNNDGYKDFVQAWSATLAIAYNNGNGNFTAGPTLATIGTGNDGAILAVADFNNDSKPDILARNTSQVYFYISNSQGGYNGSFYPINSSVAHIFTAADFTGDGFKDVLVKASSFNSLMNPTKPATLLINNGAGVFTASSTEAAARSFSLGDLDGDNKADLLLSNNNTYSGMWLGENQIHFQKNVCQRPSRTKIVDFDGDNLTDRAFFRASDGRWRFRKSSDNSIVTLNWGLSGDIPQPGDFDGDRKTDVAVYRPSNGTWYIVNSSNGAFTIARFGTAEDKPVASDFNGDGATDIAVYRPSDGNWYVYFIASEQYSITHFGIAEDKPVPEDFDADGKTDLAVFRPSTGTWYYLKSSDGNSVALRWGIPTDIPLPADFDGDGKADLNVFRPSEQKWYLLKSTDSQLVDLRFGTTGDVPQISDWDGSGTFDLAIYRPDAKLWYWTINNLSTDFGEPGEIPVSSTLRAE
jgi:FG-GAP-like repeat